MHNYFANQAMSDINIVKMITTVIFIETHGI